MKRTIFLTFSVLSFYYFQVAFAHDPIFMTSPEAPYKGAFDLHTSVKTVTKPNERELEVEQELTYGITRNLATGISLPLEREEEYSDSGQESVSGFSDPHLMLKYRFWNHDVTGAKYSAAIFGQSTIPVGSSIASQGRDRPSFMSGIAHGREGVHWYYVADARYLYHIQNNQSKPGDQLFLDAAYGIRPFVGGLNDTDIVYFFELNYVHTQKSIAADIENDNSGGDGIFFSPEILISPTNFLMLRLGVQLPLFQALNGAAAPTQLTTKVILEYRY
jgi:hypothetical protein